MSDKKLFQLMHKYGKLTSCNFEKPDNVDILFIEELKEMFIKNEF